MAKRTAYGKYRRLQARRARNWGRLHFGVGALAGTAAGLSAAVGDPLLSTINAIGAMNQFSSSHGAYKKARTARRKAFAFGTMISAAQKARLGMAQRGAAANGSIVLRSARMLNRSGARVGSDGMVKGYYRRGPGGQSVFVKEHQRQPAGR